MPANRAHTTVGWGTDGAISQADHDASDAAGGEVVQPDPADLGPVTPDQPVDVPDLDGVSSDDIDVESSTAAELVAWIRDAGDDAEAERRAGVVWSYESQRDGGPRATVEAEVDKHLEDDD